MTDQDARAHVLKLQRQLGPFLLAILERRSGGEDWRRPHSSGCGPGVRQTQPTQPGERSSEEDLGSSMQNSWKQISCFALEVGDLDHGLPPFGLRGPPRLRVPR